jgi:hypothetical protein
MFLLLSFFFILVHSFFFFFFQLKQAVRIADNELKIIMLIDQVSTSSFLYLGLDLYDLSRQVSSKLINIQLHTIQARRRVGR